MDENLLKEAELLGILDMDSLQSQIEMAKKQAILKQHKFAISQLPNGQFQTYIINPETGKRKEIRAITRERVEDRICKLTKEYEIADHNKNIITLDQLYQKWIDYKARVTQSPNTITRHKQHYKRYFEGSALFSEPLDKITVTDLEAFCNELIKSNNMTSREWTNVKTVLGGIFKLATRNKLIPSNLMKEIEITVRFRQIPKKTGKTETYNSEELEQLNKYLDEKFSETNDTAFLACRINFYLGLRVGELVALKWSDLIDMNHLHIQREEIRIQSENRLEVVDHTKTYTDRVVPLVPKAILILQKIQEASPVINNNSYIFVRDGERITARQIAYILEKYAERSGNPVKSTHKMRKTFASRAAVGRNGEPGISLDAVREILGHNDLKTTLGYIYNPDTEKETYEKLKAVL